MIIRTEQSQDINDIYNITKQAFLNAPYSDHTEQFIVNALRSANVLTISLVAELDNKLIGHLAISLVTISDGSTDWYGLGPVSVLPEYQNLGIGSKLINKGLEQLKELGASGCVLLGEPDYYCRFGFKADPKLVLPDVPPEYFQVMYFDNSSAQGYVSYHKSFNATS